MNQLTTPILTMSSRDIAELTEKPHDNVLKLIRSLIDGGIVNSTTPNLNPMGYAQNWTHLKMFGGV